MDKILVAAIVAAVGMFICLLLAMVDMNRSFRYSRAGRKYRRDRSLTFMLLAIVFEIVFIILAR